jgi:hypothetical protein
MEFLIALFESLGLYSSENGLGEHLRGLAVNCRDGYTGQSIYNIVFIYLFVINSLLIINYYYGFFNRRPFNRWGWWLLNVLVSGLILYIVAYIYPHNDLVTGRYCSSLKINDADCTGFALTAAIYSMLWSIILSVIIKWKSGVNKKVPF